MRKLALLVSLGLAITALGFTNAWSDQFPLPAPSHTSLSCGSCIEFIDTFNNSKWPGYRDRFSSVIDMELTTNVTANYRVFCPPDTQLKALQLSMAAWFDASSCVPHDFAKESDINDPDPDFRVHWVPRELGHDLYPDVFENVGVLSVNSRAATSRFEWDYFSCKIQKAEIFLISNPVQEVISVFGDTTLLRLSWGRHEDGRMQCWPSNPDLPDAFYACDDTILDLRRVLAHEYGHVLGLSHANDPADVDRAWLMSHIVGFPGTDHKHSFNPSPCELKYIQNLYMAGADGPECDHHVDAFVDDFRLRSGAGGVVDLTWSCASQDSTSKFLVYSGASAFGPWQLAAEAPLDPSGLYTLAIPASGPFIRLREVEASGDTLHCMTDSLMAQPPLLVEPSSAVVDSLRAGLKAVFSAPEPVNPDPGPTTDWVCIGPSGWKTTAKPLLDFWNTHGHVARYKEINYLAAQGWPTLKAYLANLYNVGSGTLKYVLLLGDADDHQTLGKDVIPTNYHADQAVGTWSPNFASDWDYVDFDNNRIPRVAVGRAPVRNADEVTLFIDKTIRAVTHMGNPAIPVDRVGLWEFARDNGDRTGVRVTTNGDKLRDAFPARFDLREIRDDFVAPLSSATKTAMAVAAMEEGRSAVAIMGVGSSYNNWDGFVNSSSFSWTSTAPAWRLHPFLVGMSCGIGSIDLPEVAGRPLIETGILEPGRGPWGSFGLSRGTWLDGSRRIGEKFFSVVNGSATTSVPVGLAAIAAISAFANTGYANLAWSHMLVGDPAVPLSNGVIGSSPAVSISGPTTAGPGVAQTWTATPTGGNGIYQMAWYKQAIGDTMWTPCGDGAQCVTSLGTRNIQLRCIVLSAGLSGERVVCVGSTSQPASTTITVSGLAIVSTGQALVDAGDEPTFVAEAADQTCRAHTYDWRTRAAGTTVWSGVVGTGPSYHWPTPLVSPVDLLATAWTEGQQVSQVVEVRIRTSGDPGGGCPTLEVKGSGGWITENTILGRTLAGTPLLDDYRIRATPDTSGGKIAIRIRESEQEYTTLDQVRLIAVDHSIGSRAYASGETVLLGTPVAASRVTKSTGEDVTAQLSGMGYYAGQPDDTLLVEMESVASVSTLSAFVGSSPNATNTGGGGGDVIDDGGGKGPQPGVGQLGAPSPSETAMTDAAVLGTSGIVVQAPSGQGEWETVLHHYPREKPDGALLDTVGYSRLRLIFVGRHDVRFIGRLVRSSEPLFATKLPLLSAQHSRHGDVSQAVSAQGNVVTDLAPGDTVSLSFQNVPLASNRLRDLFLFTNGVYTSNLPAGAHPRGPDVPTRFGLRQNQPNPFSAATLIRFDLPVASPVRVEVFDLQGRLIRTLADGRFEAGSFSVLWDHVTDSGSPVRPGVYLYRMSAGTFQAQAKMLLLP